MGRDIQLLRSHKMTKLSLPLCLHLFHSSFPSPLHQTAKTLHYHSQFRQK